MDYIELFIPVCDQAQAEIWMAELAEMPFDSFQQDDTSLKAYIRKDDYENNKDIINDFIRSVGVQCSLTEIETVNWNSVWESGFEPVDVEGKCLIRAPFHEGAKQGQLDIVIMPKMSFGTGHHATTWLMTSFLMSDDFTGKQGLDMGSGTGVLAIIAVKRGADSVDAVDIDTWAYENCLENIAENGVSPHIQPILGDVSAIAGKSYDFILANINRNILLSDMSRYVEAMKPNAALYISGILESDIADIKSCAQGCGLGLCEVRLKDGWAAIKFIRQ